MEGDQNLIYESYNRNVNLYPEEYARSYKANGKDSVIDSQPSVVVFHGKPDPHDLVDKVDWIGKCWV